MKQRLRLPSQLWQSILGCFVWCAWAGLVCLAIASTVVAEDESIINPQPPSLRLSVRPQQVAIPAKNPEAGDYTLSTVQDVIVTVPPQCAGKDKCPLIVMLPGGGIPAQSMNNWLAPVAIKYGMLLMTTTKYDVNTMDAALKEILEKFAVDPDKIAIIGRCASGDEGMRFGIENLDVFSRIGSISGQVPVAGMDPQNTTAEFLIDRGFQEVGGSFAAVQALRKENHPVKQMFAIRGHDHQAEDYDFVGHWLLESWTKKPGERTSPAVIAGPLPELTEDLVNKMLIFWTSFLDEPEEIRLTGRREHLREMIVPVGEERPSVWMTDMAAMAAKYPSVARALNEAGLTAEQADACRVAMLSAMIAKRTGGEAGTIDDLSKKNIAFMDQHEALFKTLAEAGIDQQGPRRRFGGSHPKGVEALGSLGIWHTP